MNQKNIQPHSFEAEKCVVGSALLSGVGSIETMDRIRSIVRPEDFFDANHEKIWKALCRMADRGMEPDAIVLRAYLGDRLTESAEAVLLDCLEAVPSAAHAEDYARIVRDRSDRRRAILGLEELQTDPYDLTVKAPVANMVDRIMELEAETFQDDEPVTMLKAVTDSVAEYDKVSKRLPYGVRGIDAIATGTPPGSFNVLAARPGGGKTTKALNLLLSMAEQGYRVDYASLEMDVDELMPVLLCAKAQISHDKWTRKKLEEHDFIPLQKAAEEVAKLDVGIHAPESMTMKGFRAWAHRRAAMGSNIIILDYLQLLDLDDPRKPRNEQFADITRKIKQTARRIAKRGYNCRLFVLSQMNREIEKAKRRKPQLSDLRESGTLEQDADSVAFLHPIYDDKNETDQVLDVEYILAKHRSGRTGTAHFRWDKARRFYTDMVGRNFKA